MSKSNSGGPAPTRQRRTDPSPENPPASGAALMTAVNYSMSPSTYHSDPCHVPSLSSTTAKRIDQQSAAHAWTYHPQLGGQRQSSSKSMDAGSLVHALVLGKGDIVVVEHDNFRTKAAREERDAAYLEGKTPVLAKDHAKGKEIAEVVLSRIGPLNGTSEVALFWTEEDSRGKDVQCRCMVDHLMNGSNRLILFELKTCQSAHPREVEKNVLRHGYDLQAAAYVSGARKVFGQDPLHVMVFVEMEPPYVTLECSLDETFMELGERKWRRAVDVWSECLAANRWPGYRPASITAPEWALRQDMDRQLEEVEPSEWEDL